MPRIEGRSKTGGTTNESIVDGEGRLHVEADTRPIEEEVNEEFGKLFSLSIKAVDPTGADDYVMYVKNTGEKDIELYEWVASVTGAAGTIELHSVTGTSDGAAITPVNQSLGSPNTLSVNAEFGVNIVTLVDAGTLDQVALAVDESTVRHYSGHIVIPKDTAVAWLVDTATAVVTLTAYMFERQD